MNNILTAFHAKFLLLEYGFFKLKLDEIVAIFNPKNTAAIKFNKIFGFVFEKFLENGCLVTKLTNKNFKLELSNLKIKFKI